MGYVYNKPYSEGLSAGSSYCVGYANFDGYLYVKPFSTYFSPGANNCVGSIDRDG